MSDPPRPDLVPPGTHIACDVHWQDESGSHHTQIRILGDDTRGYLLMGLSVLPGGDDSEFWFRSIDEAKAAAVEFGAPDSAWDGISSIADLQLWG